MPTFTSATNIDKKNTEETKPKVEIEPEEDLEVGGLFDNDGAW